MNTFRVTIELMRLSRLEGIVGRHSATVELKWKRVAMKFSQHFDLRTRANVLIRDVREGCIAEQLCQPATVPA